MLRRAVLAVAMMVAGAGQALAEDVSLITYHGFAPYVAEEKAGLTYDLADYLSRKSGGAYTFTVQVMPRKRLDEELSGAKPVVVPWVSPAWFGDADMTKYKWTGAVVQDSNAVISPKAKPVEYTGPDALSGLKLGGVAGHKYAGVDPLVEAGKITREDANSELVNLKKVAAGRVDVTLMAESGARYMAKKEGVADQIHFSGTPHSKYERRVFVSGNDAKLADYVTKTVNGLAADPEWQKIAAKYLQ